MDLQTFRLSRIKEAAKKAGVSAVVASLPANIQYLSGFKDIFQDLTCRGQGYVLYDIEKEKRIYIMGVSYIPTILEHDVVAEIFTAGAFRFQYTEGDKLSQRVENICNAKYDTMEDALVAAISTVDGQVALDESRVNHIIYKKIDDMAKETKLVPATGLFMEARKIKHPEEVIGLRRSVSLAEKALAEALDSFRKGVTTEQELERKYNSIIVENGGRPLYYVGVAGKRAAYSDTVNTTQVIKEGQVLRFDFGCQLDGYWSDIARTAVVGDPDSKALKYYDAVKKGTETAIASLAPGKTAEEIFHIAVNSTRENGIQNYDRHHCGHGIGLEIYDNPSISNGNGVQLEAGMTLCIETPYYEIGWGGVQIEHTVEITDSGVNYIDSGSNELIVIE